MKNKTKIIILIVFVSILSIGVIINNFFIKKSYSLTSDIESNTYKIKNNTIYATPTAYEYYAPELLSRLDYTSDIEILDANNNDISLNDLVKNNYKLKVNNNTYNIVLLGDVTSDGKIQIGDISALFNYFKDNSNLNSYQIEAGKVTGGDTVSLGDVSKLYNYYQGKSPFTTYEDYQKELTEEEIEDITLNKINEIRSTGNTDISKRDQSKIFYVSLDGDDTNDGKSPESAIKTLDKVNELSRKGTIKDGSTILFRDGDEFRGRITLLNDNLLFGSYGDISKGKPILNRSLYDGAKEGTWVEVKPNIWKYTLDDSDEVFNLNVGTLWFYCNKNNNNCSRSMTSQDRTFDFAQMITTNRSYDETDIESHIDELLTNDLEFYHVGHAHNAVSSGKQLYLYSTSNPSERFDDIEFNMGGHNIYINGHNNLTVDNLKITHTGSHGIGGSTMSNFVVTNCEIGFIGGMVQNYNNDTPTRYGNAVEIYGSVMDKDGVSVDDGFVVDNNYIYQCYDAGPTFQLSAEGLAHMEKARFTNNVLEYNNYNIEYWMSSEQTSGDIYDNSYIKDFLVENNILRYAGTGICETRPDKTQSAHIKTWFHKDGAYNIIKGRIAIRNNLFYKQTEQAYYWRTNSDSMPQLVNNTFYGNYGDNFGYISNVPSPTVIKFNDVLLKEDLPGNNYVLLDKELIDLKDDTGTTGSDTWIYDSKTYTLTITGNGDMADYTESNLPPWNKYRDYIYNIIIDEGVTSLGEYAFYNFYYVRTFRINAINLKDLRVSTENPNYGANYTTYNMGISTTGTTLYIGPNVTRIPKMFLKPMEDYNKLSFIKDIVFEGNNLKTISNYGLAFYRGDGLTIPSGVTTVAGLGLGYGSQSIMILPDSLTNVNSWSFAGDTELEKLVFGASVKSIQDSMCNNCSKLKTLVIPSITDLENSNKEALQYVIHNVDIYGDSTTESWVNSQKENFNKTNYTYHPLSEYKIKIKSSDNSINTEVSYNGTITFSTNKNVKAYYSYTNSGNNDILFRGVNITKNGNSYTINNIKSDIYLEFE